jgi:hypothetical protein
VSRPALVPIQPFSEKVLGAFLLRVKREGREADGHLHLVLRSRMVEPYLYSPVCLHGVVVNYTVKYTDNFTFYLIYLR